MIVWETKQNEFIQMKPIGYVHNEFKEAVFDEEYVFFNIIYYLERTTCRGVSKESQISQGYMCYSTLIARKDYKLIQKRRYDGKISGVFASRSPKRPNGIGLTLVELLEVEGNVLTVRGLDAIDGTPVLDLKPLH